MKQASEEKIPQREVADKGEDGVRRCTGKNIAITKRKKKRWSIQKQQEVTMTTTSTFREVSMPSKNQAFKIF